MTSQQLLRALARVLPLLVLSLAVPQAVRSQPAAPGPSELAPEARARLAQAAEDPRLAPWQRDLMLRLARTGTTAALDSTAVGHQAPLPARASSVEDGAWAAIAPSTRFGHSVIYDPLRDRMVVFGGNPSGGYLNDVWALSLADTLAWMQLTPAGTPPSARYGQSAIYDPVRDRMVIFGGSGASANFNDVWALSLAGTPAWTQLTPAGTPPSTRLGHSAIYDPLRDRMVTFGGDNSGSDLNDIWVLSLAGTPTWTQLTVTGTLPNKREGHSATYDPVRDRMVVFGGSYPGPILFNDVWAFSLAGTPAWTQLTPSGTPPSARTRHSAIYDPVRDRMVVFGGYGSDYFDDVWTLSLAGTPAWTQLAPSGTPPSGRYGHSAIYDPGRDRMVVFGGYRAGAIAFNDVWGLALADSPAWMQLTPTGTPPNARNNHSAIYDPMRRRMVIFGGHNSSYFNDVWALSLAGLPAWTQLIPTGTPPSARSLQSAIYDPIRNRMVVFGGDSSGSRFNDVWALSLEDTPAWTQLTLTGTPPSGRCGHSAIYDPLRDRMVVFGGSLTSIAVNEVWALSLEGTPAWTQLTPTGTPPSARSGHSAIYDPVRDCMVVFAGIGSGYLNDVWALSLAGTPAWTQLAPSGTPASARTGHSAICDPVRDRMVVFGGSSTSGHLNDVWALSLAGTPAWTQLTPSGTAPSARSGHSAICNPVRDRMVVFGGSGSGLLNDVWALEWSTTAAVDDPAVPALISSLRPPVPNPTHGTAALSFAFARAGRVQLGVYDVSGRLVRKLVDGERRAGTETVVWNGTDELGAKLGAGVYFVRLAGPGLRETRRVVLLR